MRKIIIVAAVVIALGAGFTYTLYKVGEGMHLHRCGWRQRQPTDLVVMKGKKHLTKAEIEARKNAEVVAPNDKVKPPAWV